MEIKVEGLYFLNQNVGRLHFGADGVVGDTKGGFIKASDVRDRVVFGRKAKGEMVLNWRQWSGVSVEDLDDVARKLELSLSADTLAKCMGATFLLSGFDKQRFSKLPIGSVLDFESGLRLLVMSENTPCVDPGRKIAELVADFDPSRFVSGAFGFRGLVGMVYLGGQASLGDKLNLSKMKTWGLDEHSE